MRQEQHAVADLGDLDHVVRGPQHRGAGARDPLDHGARIARHRGIERGGRLVEQQEVRPVQHRLRQSDARLLAGGKHAALHVAKANQLELGDQLFDALSGILHAVDPREEAQVLLHGQVAGQRCVHRREVRAGERPRSARRHVDALDRHRARARLEHAEDHVDRGGLAGAVGTEQSHDLARGDAKRDVVYGDRGAVGLAETIDREGGARPIRLHGPVDSGSGVSSAPKPRAARRCPRPSGTAGCRATARTSPPEPACRTGTPASGCSRTIRAGAAARASRRPRRSW